MKSIDEGQFVANLINGSRRQFLVNQLFNAIEQNPASINLWAKNIHIAKMEHEQKRVRTSLRIAIISSLTKLPPSEIIDRWDEI